MLHTGASQTYAIGMLPVSLAYDWNDLRLFLALVRTGSVRAAAGSLGIGRATVSRRIRDFENGMKTRLFEADSWDLTPTGEILLSTAEQVELQLADMERRVIGQDMRLEGTVRLLAPDFLVANFLMPTIRDMAENQPGIDIEMVHTMNLEQLTRRDAELAIWLGKDPPLDLLGRQLAPLNMSTYRQRDVPEPQAWVGFGRGLPTTKWIASSIRPNHRRRGAYESVMLQYEAVRAGLGIAELPCFIAEQDASIERLPDSAIKQTYSLWLLRHAETKKTARLKYVSDRLFGALSGVERSM